MGSLTFSASISVPTRIPYHVHVSHLDAGLVGRCGLVAKVE